MECIFGDNVITMSEIELYGYNENWKRVIIMNEFETTILKIVQDHCDADSEVQDHVERCNYDDVLLWAVEHCDDKDLLNHAWSLLCQYQTLRLGQEEKNRWLWSMAQKVHQQHKSK